MTLKFAEKMELKEEVKSKGLRGLVWCFVMGVERDLNGRFASQLLALCSKS